MSIYPNPIPQENQCFFHETCLRRMAVSLLYRPQKLPQHGVFRHQALVDGLKAHQAGFQVPGFFVIGAVLCNGPQQRDGHPPHHAGLINMDGVDRVIGGEAVGADIAVFPFYNLGPHGRVRSGRCPGTGYPAQCGAPGAGPWERSPRRWRT